MTRITAVFFALVLLTVSCDTNSENTVLKSVENTIQTPQWSSDGNSIIYVSYIDYSEREIYRLNIQSGETGLIFAEPVTRFINTGNSMIYQSIHDTNSHPADPNLILYRYDYTTNNRTFIAEYKGDFLTASPDEKLVLISNHTKPMLSDSIIIRSTSDANTKRIDVPQYSYRSQFDWSAQTGNIVYNYENTLYIVDTTGTVINEFSPGSAETGNPAFIPDGSGISFEQSGYIKIMDNSGNNTETITRGEQHDWSPDGSKILFLRIVDYDTQLFIRDMNSGVETLIKEWE